MNTATTDKTTIAEHEANFRNAVDGLRKAKAKFESALLKPVPYADERALHLSAALKALAGMYGVNLQGPLHIDSNGEYSLAALKDDGSNPSIHGCAPFGAFAEILNPHSPRTGLAACTLQAESGWCRIGHFGVESMVVAQAAARGI